MSILRTILIALWMLPPKPAAYVAATVIGRPDVAPMLVRVCRRESRCKPIGLHARDADLRPHGGYGGQVQLGHLRPWCQRYGARRWSTRGAFGLWASAHWAYMPPCFQPEWFDVPVISAYVAAKKYVARCEGRAPSGWCPRERRRSKARERAREGI